MAVLKEGQAGTTVWSLMSESRRLQCADPRDRAYAILSCTSMERRLTKVDYTISVTVLAKRILRGPNKESLHLPKLSVAISRAQRAVSIFRLQPDALLEITEGLLDSTTTVFGHRAAMFRTPDVVPMCTPIKNHGLPKDSPQFHILSYGRKVVANELSTTCSFST